MKQGSAHKVRVPDATAELVRGLHPHLKKKLRAALDEIALSPHGGKALKQELAGLRSFRVGGFRVIYRIGGKRQVEIVAIGPRESIYEETYRLVRRRK
jgi:mRNA interferase RelE/StbE